MSPALYSLPLCGISWPKGGSTVFDHNLCYSKGATQGMFEGHRIATVEACGCLSKRAVLGQQWGLTEL